MNQIPSFAGSGSIWFTVAPPSVCQALMAACMRTVEPEEENV
jgi:hypothetical protein